MFLFRDHYDILFKSVVRSSSYVSGGPPMKEQVTVVNNPKLIGVCMSQAHTFLKDDFLCVLEQEAR